jgi:hypothetical protein
MAEKQGFKKIVEYLQSKKKEIMAVGETMNVNTFIKAAENGDLQRVKEYIDGGGYVDAKKTVS